MPSLLSFLRINDAPYSLTLPLKYKGIFKDLQKKYKQDIVDGYTTAVHKP